MTHMKAPRWKGHRKYGLYFQFDSHNLNNANYKHKATIARSMCRQVAKLKNIDTVTWLNYTVIFKIYLLWASLEKTIVMYHIVNSNVFYILFATNKCISGCVFSNQAHRLCCGAYFQVRVLANIDHTFVSIASLFAAIKIYIFKIKVIRVKSIFIKLNWLHN